jgi:hypothetical protein
LPIVSAFVQQRRQAPIEPPALDTCSGIHHASFNGLLGEIGSFLRKAVQTPYTLALNPLNR